MTLSIVVGFLDGFGLAMFLPLLQIAEESNVSKVNNLENLNFIIKGMQSIGLRLSLLNILIVLSTFFLLKGLAQYLSGVYEVNIRQYFIKKTRKNLTKLLSDISFKSFVISDIGRIQNTMSGEILKISQAYQNYFSSIQQLIMVFVYMLFAFIVDAKFALLICVGGALTNIIYTRVYKVTIEASHKLTYEANFYQGLVIQYISVFKYLKATGLLKFYNEKLFSTINEIEKNNQKIGKLGAIVNATREPLLIIVVSIVILVQINILNGSLGSILISMLFFYRALSALILMQTSYNSFLSVSGSLDNVTNFENELINSYEKNGVVEIVSFKDIIKLKNSQFSYIDQPIINNITLEIRKNQTIAFVGESGSGKSTLVNIIVGLIPLDGGEMTIDGINRTEINILSYQKRIGYITQDPVVFNDSIYNNITLWAEPNEENFKRYELAIKQASIQDFIGYLPEKENTVLGNSGINLSGGQKQRISIARELFKNVDILVLDEATSALDSETERVIQRNIDDLHGKYTILIIAHRLSTIKNADRIILMNKGEIVEEGNFTKLRSSSLRFRKMVELQEV